MVGMQNHGSLLYLFKLADFQSLIHHNSGVCFGPFHQPFVLHATYEMLLTFDVV